jgi:hypothetical protein
MRGKSDEGKKERQGEQDVPGSDSRSPLSIIFILGYDGFLNIHPQCEYHNPLVDIPMM